MDMGRIRVRNASKFNSDFLMSALRLIKRTKKQSDTMPVIKINLE